MSDRLVDMLKQADADAMSPGADKTARECVFVTHIVEEAGRRVRRRRAVRAAAGVVAMVAIAAGVYATFLQHRPGKAMIAESTMAVEPAVAQQPPVAAIRAEIAQLDQAADAALAIVDRLEQQRRLRRHAADLRRISGSSPELDRALAAESAAQTMLLRGDRLAKQELTKQLAPAAYQRVIELFPASAAADAAQQRLAAYPRPKGDRA